MCLSSSATNIKLDIDCCCCPSSRGWTIWSEVPSLRRCLPRIHGCGRAFVGAVEEMMCVVCVWLLHMGYIGDGCDLASTLC